jgi:hypothetical protein
MSAEAPNGLHYQWIFITRAAVPIFFMITGWFYCSTVAKNREKKQIFKIAKLLIICMLLYFPWEIIYNLMIGSFSDFLNCFTTPSEYINFLIFNRVSGSAGHLWYLGSLLYTLIAAYVCRSFIKNQKIRTLLIITAAIGLLAVHLVFDEILHVRNMYTRNWLMVGIPLFLLGVLLFKYRNRIQKLSMPLLIVGFAASIIAGWFEVSVAGQHDLYTTTVFIAILLFIIFNKINIKDNFFSAAGRKHSLNIYIIHNVLIKIYLMIMASLGLAGMVTYFMPLIIFAASLVISIIFENIKGKVIAFSKSKKAS